MKVDTWTNGSSKFVDVENGGRWCKATLKGKFNGYLLAELKLKTQKMIYFRDDIEKLKEE